MHLNATPLEWLWTLPGLIGLPPALWLLYLVVGDNRYQRGRSNNRPERIWSTSQVWTKIERCLVLMLTSSVGLVAIFTPPAKPNAPPSRVAYTLTVALVLIPLLLMIGALQTYINRRRVLAAEADRVSQRRRRTDSPDTPG